MSRIVAVIPAYEPGDDLVDLVVQVGAQVDHVVVVDDGTPAGGAHLHLDACRRAGATVLRHDTNRGIAAALNTAVGEALTHTPGLDAVLTLDQDSYLGPAYVRSVLDAWAAALAAGLAVGLVAPEHVTGLPAQTRWHRRGVALARDPIQSGTLVPAGTWSRVGRFDESLFIDGVDADFALRCLEAGLAVVVAERLTLGHRLGTLHEVSVGGRSIALTRPAPFRYYYLARNRVRLVRRYARRHPRWAVGQTLGLASHLVLSLALLPDRRVRAGEAWHGIRDAARGVTGRRPETGGSAAS